MKAAVTLFRALADETRWRIVHLVMERALCVCEIADILGMPQSSVSSHVQVIRRAGLLESETRGKWTYFRIEPGSMPILLSILEHFPDPGTFASDWEKAEARLLRREASCCPGSLKLGTRPRTLNQCSSR